MVAESKAQPRNGKYSVGVLIDVELRDALAQIASADERSLASVIRRALEREVEREGTGA